MKIGRVVKNPEGSSLEAADHPLAVFYASHLKWQSAGRVGSSELRAAYLAWAARHQMPALSFKQLRQEMVRLGHRHIHSNRMWFTDVTVLGRPRTPKQARAMLDQLRTRAGRRVAVDRVDEIVEQLRNVRRELTELRGQLDLPFGGL